MCTPIKIVPNKSFYIGEFKLHYLQLLICILVGFEPKASMHTVHHMMLFGCPNPGTNDSYW